MDDDCEIYDFIEYLVSIRYFRFDFVKRYFFDYDEVLFVLLCEIFVWCFIKVGVVLDGKINWIDDG